MIFESLESRKASLTKMQQKTFDLLIIGGGITGVGIAQDAASRSLKVALVERGDFAVGTSSRSSKLIHGGLRYLAQGDFRVTYESCAERALLQQLAPHLVKSFSFLVPSYRIMHALQVSAGLWLYDIVSKLKNTKFHKRVGVKEAQKLAPMLSVEGLLCGYLYYDCQTNDSRLVMEVLKSAVGYGATAVNYTEATGFVKEDGRIVGAHARDLIGGGEFEIHARSVVNATGIWMDGLCQKDEPHSAGRVRPAKGVHIVIPKSRIPTDTALLFESSKRDGRSLFFIPWYEGTIIGTTDTDYKGDIDSPQAAPEDLEYILSSINRIFPSAQITESDVLSSYAGLRPLINEGGKSTKDLSRESRIFESRSGLISIAGGKLTTYRRMAIKVVDMVVNALASIGWKGNVGNSKTHLIYLSSLDPNRPFDKQRATIKAQAAPLGIDNEAFEHLVSDYGGNAGDVIGIVRKRPELKARLIPELPFIQAEVVYAARSEQAARLEDFLMRRTRIGLLTRDRGAACVETVAQLMGEELDWKEADKQAEIDRFRESAAHQLAAI